MSESGTSASRRILIIKLSSLGDLFHALPAVHRIKAAWDAEIDWVTQPEYADLVRCFDDVNRVFVYPRRNFLRGMRPLIRELRSGGAYDEVLDLQGLFKSALVSRLARGKRRIAPSFHREFSQFLHHEVAGPTNRNRHAIDQVMDTVRHLGLEPSPVVFPVTFPSVPLESPRPRVALIPQSRWATKNWPPERFIEVGNALMREREASLHLIGSKEDQAACGKIEQGLKGAYENLCGKTGLVELGGYLQQMDLVISVDSGPMHMAAALGVPVIAVFGATDPLRTGPYGLTHRVITCEDLPCRPCRSRVCQRPQKDIACLNDLPATRVIDAALEMLR